MNSERVTLVPKWTGLQVLDLPPQKFSLDTRIMSVTLNG